jgi:hypothetical protein
MPSHYGFVTSAEIQEQQRQAALQQQEIKRKEVARIHPLISSVLNDLITALSIPGLYLERQGAEWYIFYETEIVYSIVIVQQGTQLWLEYEDAVLRQVGTALQQQCTQANMEKVPAVLKLIVGVDVQPASSAQP